MLDLLDSGDHAIAMKDLYGGTTRLFEQVLKRSSGLEFSYINMSNEAHFQDALTPRSRMIWIESPTNPMMNLVDFDMIVNFAKKNGLLTVVDNTFASPWVQRPLEFDIDVVLHSATKYLNGHSDVIGGAVVVGDNPDLADRIRFLQNAVGSVASPFDSYLVQRGLKTLSVRMERHNQNAQVIAEWLTAHKTVQTVHYPGLPSHPQFEICQTQMSGRGGGMLSVTFDLDLEQTKRVLENCRVFALAESLGGVESLIEHPAIMTHASIPAEIREQIGVTDGLVRLSVGIEDVSDLINDLEHALSTV